MAKDLPYVGVPGKISDLFKKIADAKVPDSFTQSYLSDTLGFKGKNDRALIGLLKSMGILDSSGKPTARYRELKNDSSKSRAIGEGVREAYSLLYDSNENAHDLNAENLRGLVAQVSGADKDHVVRITSTLTSLIKEANFEKLKLNDDSDEQENDEEALVETSASVSAAKKNLQSKSKFSQSNSEFHFNIQVHLPNNGTEETYLNIFNAIREAFQ